MIIALGVLFMVITLFLVKTYHTVDSSRDEFINRGGAVFSAEVYMQDFDEGTPITKAIYAVVRVRKQTNILEIIKAESEKKKDIERYHWLAIAVMDPEEKNWLVTYRENNVVPKYVCKATVNIESGKSSLVKCDYSGK